MSYKQLTSYDRIHGHSFVHVPFRLASFFGIHSLKLWGGGAERGTGSPPPRMEVSLIGERGVVGRCFQK